MSVTSSSRRAYASRRAVAARRRMLESIDRGEGKACRKASATCWPDSCDKRPYLTPDSHRYLASHGRKRLLPVFGNDALGRIDDERVRDRMQTMADLVKAGELAPKTANDGS